MPRLSLDRWKNFLYHASRSRSFLWKFAVIALVTGGAVGWTLSQSRPSSSYLFGERVLGRIGLAAPDEDKKFQPPTDTAPGLFEALTVELPDTSLRFIDVLWAMPGFARHLAVADYEKLRVAVGTRFSADESALATQYLAASDLLNHAAFDRLQELASRPAPQRYARYALGDIQMKRKNYRAASDLFRAEGKTDDAYESRFMAIRALIELKDFPLLTTLRSDPQYRHYFTPHVELKLAVGERHWADILEAIPVSQINSYQHNVMIVTVVAGLAWTLFLLRLGEVSKVFSRIGALCAAGFLAGVASTTLTIFFVLVQDDILGFSAGEDMARTFAYYLAGVGAREELCKLLLFAPLLPFLIKRDDELEALLVAAFVGLGFAIEENGNYFMMSQAAGAPGRFLTANFFHIALTGLNGLALFRAFTRGMGGLNDLMLVLPLTIVAHGAYDAFLNLPDLEGAPVFATIVYIGFSFYFFSRVHPLRNGVRMTLSLTGAFVFGLSLLAATVIAFQMATLGATAGASLIFSELIGSGVLLVMFFREFREPLTH